MRNHDLDAFLKKNPFLAGKWAWTPRWRQSVSGFKTRPKSWPIVWNFWVSRYLRKKIENLGPEPPFPFKCIVNSEPSPLRTWSPWKVLKIYQTENNRNFEDLKNKFYKFQNIPKI